MFGTIANGTLLGCKYKIKSQHFEVWYRIESIANKDLMLVKIFICSLFTSDNQCPKISYFGLFTCINVKLKSRFLTTHCNALNWNKHTKMSDNSIDVHFSSAGSICSTYFAIKSVLASHAPIMMRAANECYAVKMNMIVLLPSNRLGSML